MWRQDHRNGRRARSSVESSCIENTKLEKRRREEAKREEFKEKTTKQPLRQCQCQVSWWNQTQNRSYDQRASQRRHTPLIKIFFNKKDFNKKIFLYLYFIKYFKEKIYI